MKNLRILLLLAGMSSMSFASDQPATIYSNFMNSSSALITKISTNCSNFGSTVLSSLPSVPSINDMTTSIQSQSSQFVDYTKENPITVAATTAAVVVTVVAIIKMMEYCGIRFIKNDNTQIN